MKTTGRRFVTLPESELAAQLIELRELRRQVSELQAHSTRVAEASLARQVRAFHLKFGHPVAATPAVPEDAQVRFRLALIAEEFFELLDAALNGGGDSPVKRTIMRDIRDADLEVDLPELADAMADLDDDLRFVFEAHILQGRTYRDIAAQTGEPMGTLMARNQRAVHAVRARLQHKGFWPDTDSDPDAAPRDPRNDDVPYARMRSEDAQAFATALAATPSSASAGMTLADSA